MEELQVRLDIDGEIDRVREALISSLDGKKLSAEREHRLSTGFGNLRTVIQFRDAWEARGCHIRGGTLHVERAALRGDPIRLAAEAGAVARLPRLPAATAAEQEQLFGDLLRAGIAVELSDPVNWYRSALVDLSTGGHGGRSVSNVVISLDLIERPDAPGDVDDEHVQIREYLDLIDRYEAGQDRERALPALSGLPRRQR